MKVLFAGDVMGRSGRKSVLKEVPRLKKKLGLDFIVVNGENAAGGFGITEKIAEEFFECGVDCITSGNHIWAQREVFPYLDKEQRILRPLNYPEGAPGHGVYSIKGKDGKWIVVINAMGRVFMDALDDPFRAVERILESYPLGDKAKFILVDMHGEATSEKMAMGQFCDGRASLVVGTHSHVPTADAQIFPGGTAYQTDAGMCGDYDSIIGMKKDEPLHRFRVKVSNERFSPADGEATFCGVLVESDDGTGLAKSVTPIRLGGRLKPSHV